MLCYVTITLNVSGMFHMWERVVYVWMRRWKKIWNVLLLFRCTFNSNVDIFHLWAHSLDSHSLFLMLSDIRIIINFSSRLSEDWKSQCDAMTSASQCTGKMSELDYNFNLMRRFIMYSPPFISYITANLLLSDQINVCVIMLLLW